MLDYNLIIYWEQSLSITLFLLQGKLPVYEYMKKQLSIKIVFQDLYPVRNAFPWSNL